MASHLNETLSSMHLVQAFGRERHEANRFQTHSGNALSHSLENAKLESAAARAVEITTAAGTCAVICIGSLLVLRNEMSPGMVLVFSSYLHGLYRPIRRMVKLVIRISRLQVSGARIGEILAAAPQVTDRRDAQWVRYRLAPDLAPTERAILDAVMTATPEPKRMAKKIHSWSCTSM